MRILSKLRIRRLDRMPPPSKTVAIVVPLSSRPGLTRDEEVSLRHLQHHLGKYDKFMLASQSLPITRPPFEVKRFDDHYFGSAKAHARFQFSPELYEAFIDYKYILMYHLDSLVFSDQLMAWCARDFDFIGAPWFPGESTPWAKEKGVGNSGFSLHKVRSFLRVIYSPNRMIDPAVEWEAFQKNGSARSLLRTCRRWFFFRNNVRSHMSSWLAEPHGASDTFFSFHAKRYFPEFHIATPEEALQFAFETDPRGCFRRSDGKLPFGCHAWGFYDRAFWEPHLLAENC